MEQSILNNNDIIITSRKITQDQLKALCERWFGDMVKITADVKREILGIGGDLHADAEALLIQNGSSQQDIWGANFYPWNPPDQRVDYTALINIRPKQDNLSLEILDSSIKEKIKKVVEDFILGPDETLV